MKQQVNAGLPFEISVIITHHKGLPCIELRRSTTDIEAIKSLISCAFHSRPIIVLPIFQNRIRAISSLMDKGLIYLNKDDGKYYFNI